MTSITMLTLPCRSNIIYVKRIVSNTTCILTDLKEMTFERVCMECSILPLASEHLVNIQTSKHTVNSRYLELGYLEFCETRSVYWGLFYKPKLPEINLHFG